ncbi:hypothetical protein [Flagellimonas sp.]|uniref:hypothetical protein n=1 Tax=Flagellimonas sp. TaxID=2058762 RepID=UPI003B4FFFD4
MEKQNPFKDVGYPHKEVPEELKGIIMRNVETIKLFMEMYQNNDEIYKTAVSSLFKTEVNL